jgi:hypothetical protein
MKDASSMKFDVSKRLCNSQMTSTRLVLPKYDWIYFVMIHLSRYYHIGDILRLTSYEPLVTVPFDLWSISATPIIMINHDLFQVSLYSSPSKDTLAFFSIFFTLLRFPALTVFRLLSRG